MSTPELVFHTFLKTAPNEDKKSLRAFARVVRTAVQHIESLNSDTCGVHVATVREALRARGHEAGCHVGLDSAKTAIGAIEWYAGQLLDIYDNGAWFAMNSFINMLDTFCPEWMCEAVSP